MILGDIDESAVRIGELVVTVRTAREQSQACPTFGFEVDRLWMQAEVLLTLSWH
jgi:hypothetical protein